MQHPTQWHIKNHRFRDGYLPRIKECRRCQEAKTACFEKRDFKTREEADKRALAINVERRWWPGECMKAYRCRFCKIWHLTTATRRVDQERVEKMRRKWLRRTRQKDNDNGGTTEVWRLPEAS